jgi:hypothetical protein
MSHTEIRLVEPPRMRPPAHGAVEWDVLVATKLHVPQPRSQRQVVWLSLDTGDNDPARFWRYLAAALDPACAGIAEPVAGLLRGPQPPLEAAL